MKKSDLAARVAAKLSVPKTTADASVTAVFSFIGDVLVKGESVSIAGFGTFSVKERAGRQGRNLRTGESIAMRGLEGALVQGRERGFATLCVSQCAPPRRVSPRWRLSM